MNFKEALIAHLQGENVECTASDGAWLGFGGCFGAYTLNYLSAMAAEECWKFRIAPRTIMVNGVEVPAPATCIPDDFPGYFTPDPTDENYCYGMTWDGDKMDLENLRRGLVYLNKEDAIARAKAMLITS